MTISKLTAEQAQQILQPLSFEEVHQHFTENIDVIYLGYLCARGKVREVTAFLDQLGDTARDVINMRHEDFQQGTVLHVALYWNSGRVGRELFDLLYNYEAEYYENSYGQFPWEQRTESIWIDPMDDKVLGMRDGTEFIQLYNEICIAYGLAAYEDEPEAMG